MIPESGSTNSHWSWLQTDDTPPQAGEQRIQQNEWKLPPIDFTHEPRLSIRYWPLKAETVEPHKPGVVDQQREWNQVPANMQVDASDISPPLLATRVVPQFATQYPASSGISGQPAPFPPYQPPYQPSHQQSYLPPHEMQQHPVGYVPVYSAPPAAHAQAYAPGYFPNYQGLHPYPPQHYDPSLIHQLPMQSRYRDPLQMNTGSYYPAIQPPAQAHQQVRHYQQTAQKNQTPDWGYPVSTSNRPLEFIPHNRMQEFMTALREFAYNPAKQSEVVQSYKDQINVADDNNHTVLWEAARTMSGSVVQMLIDAGAQTDIVDCNGRTPLVAAVRYRNISAAIQLNNNMASLGNNNTERTMLMNYACKYNEDAGLIIALLRRGLELPLDYVKYISPANRRDIAAAGFKDLVPFAPPFKPVNFAYPDW
jgi:hypothetical protein